MSSENPFCEWGTSESKLSKFGFGILESGFQHSTYGKRKKLSIITPKKKKTLQEHNMMLKANLHVRSGQAHFKTWRLLELVCSCFSLSLQYLKWYQCSNVSQCSCAFFNPGKTATNPLKKKKHVVHLAFKQKKMWKLWLTIARFQDSSLKLARSCP